MHKLLVLVFSVAKSLQLTGRGVPAEDCSLFVPADVPRPGYICPGGTDEREW